ncbi:MAG TPA: SDR family oxidoreductase [Chloroflexota bacterium]|nr:SDR family oxidoreductase [Chloroflexota bacterium]
MSELAGTTAVITGGASGIGLATARGFVAEGVSVVIVDRDQRRAREVLRELGDNFATAVVGDVRDDTIRDGAAAAAEATGKPVRYLVNCAASFLSKGESASQGDWEVSLGVNVAGTALMASAIVPLIRKAGGGAIVNTASISGWIAQPDRWTYNATKGAILALTRCQALDLAKDNIRVNSVSPGTIWTPELDRMAGGDRAKWEPVFAPHHMLNRVGEPEEVAATILFLCGAGASFITGADLRVDGGYTAMGHDGPSTSIQYTK